MTSVLHVPQVTSSVLKTVRTPRPPSVNWGTTARVSRTANVNRIGQVTGDLQQSPSAYEWAKTNNRLALFHWSPVSSLSCRTSPERHRRIQGFAATANAQPLRPPVNRGRAKHRGSSPALPRHPVKGTGRPHISGCCFSRLFYVFWVNQHRFAQRSHGTYESTQHMCDMHSLHIVLVVGYGIIIIIFMIEW